VGKAVVLDSSALLALLRGDTGAERVGAWIDGTAISAVMLSDVAGKLRDLGGAQPEVEAAMRLIDIEVVEFNREQALLAAALLPLMRDRGLPPGDRACLALAATRGVAALTGDRIRASLDVGIAVELFR
jgi:ribonuclease VapC